MDDLPELNRRIAEHWLGKLNASQEHYLGFTEVCLAQLPHSAEALANVLAASKKTRDDKLRVVALNRRYLSFARLASKDVAAGKVEMLIKLGINMSQARLLNNLSNEEIAWLALIWQGPIMHFRDRSFVKGAAMEPGAAKHHATAYMATMV
jgi:hypothetical protein